MKVDLSELLVPIKLMSPSTSTSRGVSPPFPATSFRSSASYLSSALLELINDGAISPTSPLSENSVESSVDVQNEAADANGEYLLMCFCGEGTKYPNRPLAKTCEFQFMYV